MKLMYKNKACMIKIYNKKKYKCINKFNKAKNH